MSPHPSSGQFDALIERSSEVIQKISIGDLHKLINNVIIIPFSTSSWNLKTLDKKEEIYRNVNILRSKIAC